ncbi:MAG: DUF4282 domain-containing protein [Phenylobacterium sp.]|jgi:hypothetical protein|uniref:DUF4282 domain-containing protein n=1 Tax=Phenylobacterium sp. TaxID=1871053 RepID=UPI002A31426B|nr:DUF4282 domain-containing protein [Phenylobacterium sp.]MDD3837163.1 DUF4282 domain-containing protein [Phenylobacterium sp.]MDX9996861.1 DUF4282 domain-containing protein [Phenylobacterium sp.]
MRLPTQSTDRGFSGRLLWDLLTFDKLMTNAVVHLIYWAGLAIILLIGFGMVGAAVGIALREATGGNFMGILLAAPLLIGGLVVLGALVLLWRSFCEFYVAVFKISEDLAALREQAAADQVRARAALNQTVQR